MKILLDTCAILWAVTAPEQLSIDARSILEAPETSVAVSPISCGEIACAVDRGHLRLDRHWKLWFRHFVAQNQWQIIDITLDIVEESYSLPLPFHRDPADRLLVATSRHQRRPIVTADQKILAYPHVESLW